MRSTSSATTVLALLLLAGCATSSDPAKGGFISGVSGLLSGGYNQRLSDQSTDLRLMRGQQAAAEANANQTKAALVERERMVAALRNDVAKLDRSLKDAQARAAQQRAQNATLSDRDRQLMSDLEAARARLEVLKKQIPSSATADDYEAAKKEYFSLQAAIVALNEQLKGDRRS